MIMHQLDARTDRIIQDLKSLSERSVLRIENIAAAIHGGEYAPFANGAEWGQDTARDWMDFCFTVVTPENYRGRVVLSIVTGREGMPLLTNPQFVVWVNGEIAQAFDTQHTSLLLEEQAVPGKSYDILLQGYANSEYPGRGVRHITPPRMNIFLKDVCADVEQLVYDLEVIRQSVALVDEDSRSREQALYTVCEALNLLDLRQPYSGVFHESVAAAREYLREHYYETAQSDETAVCADVVGHTHIDVAWLWDLYQTRHKTVRSFATILKLLERYPEFTFMSSQPQLYQFVKEDRPELFERIREAVAAGRWEVEGGMWVEADCNLAGGESLIRQFLYGNEFFETEFGKRCRVLWLPDVFGYSAALPQIMRKSGIDYFFTSKLSWSEYNCVPYDTFLWEGIDGTSVLTHFTPARDYLPEGERPRPFFTTYSSKMTPEQIKGGWQRFQQKGLDNHFLVSYGYGDGGGGPTEQMLEYARRMQQSHLGVPAVRHTHVRDFFEQLEKRVGADRRLPAWYGELYLEYHRGTYTAMARNKRCNRLLERELRELELWREYSFRRMGHPYPHERLRSIWRRALTLQFHDILPGSSIKKVYDDSEQIYEELFAEVAQLKQDAFAALAVPNGDGITLFNSLSHKRDDIVYFAADPSVSGLRDPEGNVWPVQHLANVSCAFVKGIPAMGAVFMSFVAGQADLPDAGAVTTEHFETPFFRGCFDASMRITSLVDKRCGRELVRKGQSLNRLVCYENRPHDYDAWDINIYYKERFWDVEELTSASVMERGPVLTKIRCCYRYNLSEIVQDIVLYQDIARIDFETIVNWQETNYLLKAHFPVDIFYHEAAYDIQFGNVKRPTHENTTWDAARFEVCAHKWMDVSESGYGFSLLNDCKYGHSATAKDIALTLLKSSTAPNPEADRGSHRFTYSIMPHEGDWRTANTPDMAYRLNMPVTAVSGMCAALAPFAEVDCENVIVEAVKQEGKGRGSIIRMYECQGRRTNVALRMGWKPNRARMVSMMEEVQEELSLDGDLLRIEIRPYEILSLLLE